jgi:hypothetical protein
MRQLVSVGTLALALVAVGRGFDGSTSRQRPPTSFAAGDTAGRDMLDTDTVSNASISSTPSGSLWSVRPSGAVE